MGGKSWQPRHKLPHGREKTGHMAHSIDKTVERQGGTGGKMLLRRIPMLIIKTLILKKTLTKHKLSPTMLSGPKKTWNSGTSTYLIATDSKGKMCAPCC